MSLAERRRAVAWMALAAGTLMGMFTYVWWDWADRFCVFECSVPGIDTLEGTVLGFLIASGALFVIAGAGLLAGYSWMRWPLLAAGPLMVVPTILYLVARVRSTIQKPAMAMILVDAVLLALAIAGFSATRPGEEEATASSAATPASER